MLPLDVPNRSKDRVITYVIVVINLYPQKEDPNRIQITAGGNLVNFSGKLRSRMVDIMTTKLL
jgi:hypothetical protein